MKTKNNCSDVKTQRWLQNRSSSLASVAMAPRDQHGFGLCKVGRRKRRNTVCRRYGLQGGRKTDWGIKWKGGISDSRADGKMEVLQSRSQQRGLSLSVRPDLSPRGWATQARLPPQVPANIYITTHNSEVTPNLFLQPSTSPMGFLLYCSTAAGRHPSTPNTHLTAQHWSGICQPGLKKTRCNAW